VDHDEAQRLGERPDEPLQVGTEERVETEELLELAGLVEEKLGHRLAVAGDGAARLQPEVEDEAVDAAGQAESEVDQVVVFRPR